MPSQDRPVLAPASLAESVIELKKGIHDFLLAQRWYSTKALGSRTIELLGTRVIGGIGLNAMLTLWRSTGEGEYVDLAIPVALVTEEAAGPLPILGRLLTGEVLIDGLTYPPFLAEWTSMVVQDNGSRSGIVATSYMRDSGVFFEAQQFPEIHPLVLEQSNSSIRIGEWAVLKFYRRVHSGKHPEVEMGKYLLCAGSRISAPRLLGSHEMATASDEAPIFLSVLHEFIPNDGNGWDWILAHLAAGRHDMPMVWLSSLGRELAALHTFLATETERSDFKPEPATPADREEWVKSAVELANSAFQALSRRMEDELALSVEKLRAEMQTIEHQFDRLLPKRLNFSKSRYHGDLVVGQALVQEMGKRAVLTDFEGEPLRSIGERLAKHSPMRDVAGVLRSLSYAQAVTRMKGYAVCNDWEANASAAFLQGYRQHIAAAPNCPGEADFDGVVKFFLLEKAFYEILYELAYRPDWVSIPVVGVLTLLNAA